MGTTLGNAKRARELQRLFEAWRRAYDRQDAEAIATAKRAIDAAVAGGILRVGDVAAIKRHNSVRA